MSRCSTSGRRLPGNPSPRSRLARLGIAVALAGAIGAGCASTGTKGDPTYIRDYEAKRYKEAYESAKATSPKLKGAAQEQALLIQAESGHQLNKNAEAKPILRSLAESSTDPRTSGQAAATLGLIYQGEGDMTNGAKFLTTASEKLDGDAAARSALYAGDCLKSLGKTTEARDMYEKAQAKVRTDNSLRGMITDRLGNGAPTPGVGQFTLQVGAFSTQQRAQAQADRLRQAAVNAGLGSPRVLETASKGKPLYTVRVGRFTSKEAAQQAARKLGVEGMVMTGN